MPRVDALSLHRTYSERVLRCAAASVLLAQVMLDRKHLELSVNRAAWEMAPPFSPAVPQTPRVPPRRLVRYDPTNGA